MNSNQSTETSTSKASAASLDAISRRAYELWEQEGRPEGNDMQHWLQAEKELGGNRAGASDASRYTDQPRGQSSDSRPLQGSGAKPAANTKTRTSKSPFAPEKSGNGAGGVAARGRS